MSKVIGLGGLFFKSPDPAALRAWYGRVLGLEFDTSGGLFFAPDAAAAHPGAGTVLSLFEAQTDYFEPSKKEYMFNLMVDDIDGVLARCARQGVAPIKVFPDLPNGRLRTSSIQTDGRLNLAAAARRRGRECRGMRNAALNHRRSCPGGQDAEPRECGAAPAGADDPRDGRR